MILRSRLFSPFVLTLALLTLPTFVQAQAQVQASNDDRRLVNAYGVELSTGNVSFPQPNRQFPIGPDATMTPGALCVTPNAHRYPEQIAYCNRNVDGSLKQDLIHEYDVKFGYGIESMDRSKFKIDHYIPLCAGGANDPSNLWPQHESVYTITDPLEALVCEKMSEGVLLQKDAIAFVSQGKNNLSQVAAILAHLQSL